MSRYFLHGLRLQSNGALPALPTSDPIDTDVTILDAEPHDARFDAAPTITTIDEPAGTTTLQRAGDAFCFRFFDGTVAVVERDRIVVGGSNAMPHFLGLVIGFALRLHGRAALHASAIEIDGKAILFAGPSDAGKSTLAAAFARRGHRIVSENIAAVDDGVVFPGSLRMLLPDDAARTLALDGAVDALTQKRVIPAAVVERPLPLGTVFILDRASTPQAPAIEPLAPRAALVALLSVSYGNWFFTPAMRADDLAQLTRIAENVPVRSLRVGKELAALPRVCDAVMEAS